MGSEHYCLRWNNHQSNLLGVFSQLLLDESLVDVTLACAEGHSIRAHKVVLSACSSYFQTLFVDHPNRHPIVILKDVCFAELRTLVEFMYKGEVNVEYCQLSALLKTAESLKVKGLAEMTNLNAAVSSGAIKKEKEDRSAGEKAAGEATPASASPPKQAPPPAPEPPTAPAQAPTPTETVSKRLTNEGTESPSPNGRISPPGPPPSKRLSRGQDCEELSDCERERLEVPDRNVKGGCPGPTDMSASGMALCQMPPSCSSPHVSEPFPGTSCLPPVQQVPLSLKKEVDWESKSTAGESSSDFRHPPDSDFSEPDLDEKYGSACEFSADRHPEDGRPTTPFQLPFPPFGPFPDLGEGSSRQNCSLLGFLQQQGFIPPAAGVEDARYAVPTSATPYRCVICLAVFPSSWLLEQHNSLQHSINSRNSETGSPGEDKPFKCEQCGQNYRYRSAYLKHQEQNHRAKLPADKLFTCDVCGMQFRYLKSFKKHRLNHALEKLHTKSPDAEMFARARNNGAFEKYSRNASEFSIDLTSRATSLPSRVAEAKMNGETKESGRVTAPPATLMDTDHVSSSNEALGCSSGENDRAASVPVSKTDLLKFMKDEYRFSRAPAPASHSLPTKCAKTDRASDSEQDETIDSAGLPAKPPADAFRIRQDPGLVNFLPGDVSDRHKENRFSCPFCGKCVRSKENLKLHIRKHTGERPFVCLFCGRAFGGKSDLTRHLRIHTGERPYHCEMCGKCFARADYLSKHLTTHIHANNTRPSFSQGNR